MDSKLTTKEDLLSYFAILNDDPSLFTDPLHSAQLHSHLRTLQSLQDTATTLKVLSTLKYLYRVA